MRWDQYCSNKQKIIILIPDTKEYYNIFASGSEFVQGAFEVVVTLVMVK